MHCSFVIYTRTISGNNGHIVWKEDTNYACRRSLSCQDSSLTQQRTIQFLDSFTIILDYLPLSQWTGGLFFRFTAHSGLEPFKRINVRITKLSVSHLSFSPGVWHMIPQAQNTIIRQATTAQWLEVARLFTGQALQCLSFQTRRHVAFLFCLLFELKGQKTEGWQIKIDRPQLTGFVVL